MANNKRFYVTCSSGAVVFAKYVFAPTKLHARLYAVREYGVRLHEVEAREA